MSEYLEVFVEDDGTFSEPNRYDLVRGILAPEYSQISDEEIHALLESAFSDMDEAQIEDFWNTLKSIGGAAAGLLPTVGTVVGSIFGGPAGSAVGGTVGGVLSRLVSSGLSGDKKPTKQTKAKPALQQNANIPLSKSATDVLSLIQNPQFLQALLGSVVGAAGKKSVPVGTSGASADIGAFANALVQLAGKLQETADKSVESDNVPSYLYNAEGKMICSDPVSPIERAEALMLQLVEGRKAYLCDSEENAIEWLIRAGAER